ncbi:hypothetical protein CERZMDRAFT_68174 [Cercospora zeae-maydis SCOH1-5]|uniref:rhomboid protease n=1 Tax=Cercospora zeae-maydis SCOH1-5 TaxID=717836 RepID=A0A6A6FEV6_9PEZI|nr:hypothetical protein CERZMDRAFT_68174 [Cercospora zeae-maydis SCOH1-5]
MATYSQYLPDARRIRSFFLRLPLATRGLLLVMIVFYIAHSRMQGALDLWGALIPKEINIKSLYRLNTFPLIHKSFFHLLLNLFTLLPLLERFESEHGTITTFILFTGPFGLIPGLMYTFLERFIFRLNTGIVGSSIWVFLLLAYESMKIYKSNPEFVISGFGIPTWVTPIFALLLVWFLVPGTSLLGHLCGAAVGYLWGLGWIRFLAPPDKILRWVEGKLNLLGRLPHYVSVDQKTYGRYGVLPSTAGSNGGPVGSTQRLGP